ncbi:lysosomal alpha-mannosidase-like [Hibiscus syriacus]|uniref:Lysosomal alpha-mannosidase-like n=1 Tax=Hibiscus syriacus TaxID=106335 RepID=A0A6A2WCI9_HIBSY|nr:protein EARLY-RESPONSIVE TO DEHYDRATION 7, chloroplastic-like [Hibiscus syriacus]KAE8655953.1 lysosomal alpha-mannosidase-like [Hibiscus syriacus]
MDSQYPNQKPSLHPEVIRTNLEIPQYASYSSNNLYPTIDKRDFVENLFPDFAPYSVSFHNGQSYPPFAPTVPYSQYPVSGHYGHSDPPFVITALPEQFPFSASDDHSDPPFAPTAPAEAVEEVLMKIPGAIVHLIDKSYSVELACGEFSVVRLWQDNNIVAVLARVADEVQWPITKQGTAVKLDDSHYFFSLEFSKEADKTSEDGSDLLSYGLTIASKGQENLLIQLDDILRCYSCFTVQKVKGKGEKVLDGGENMSPEDLNSASKKAAMEGRCAAYWTTLAPNVEEYSGTAAKMIAAGSGQLIKGILWCGDVTIDRLNRGNEVLKSRMTPTEENLEISPEALKRIQRIKKVTRVTHKVAKGVLSGVVKVSGYFSNSVVNTKLGKRVFRLLPGEMVLATLDGFDKICDAVEAAGKNVMTTSSTVTTELVNQKYGEKAAEATSECLNAAGHAMGTAWAAFKLRKALNPKSALKSSVLAKAAAKATVEEARAKK